jgi:hypothetical protein
MKAGGRRQKAEGGKKRAGGKKEGGRWKEIKWEGTNKDN